MLTLSVLAAALCLGVPDAQAVVPPPRFERSAPLPALPSVMLDALADGVGLAQQTARAQGLQARILWIDATANIDRYNTSEKVDALVKQIRSVGFNTVVFDVKPISGQVVYPSKIAPRLSTWRGKTLPADFDPLAAMVRACHANNLPLIVSMNAFSEGHRLMNAGPGFGRVSQQTVVYQGKPIVRGFFGTFPLTGTVDPASSPDAVGVYTSTDKLPKWVDDGFAVTLTRNGTVVDGFREIGSTIGVPTIPKGGSVLYATGRAAEFLKNNAISGTKIQFETEAQFLPITQSEDNQYPLMMNPWHPEVRRYIESVVREVTTNYEIDGLVFDDRLRYSGMNGDFSPIAREQFEHYLGRKIQWPDDVFRYTVNMNLSRGIQPGPYFSAWMTWRAKGLHDFYAGVRNLVKSVRPTASMGLYAGSWYGEYPALGNNYASPDLDAGFWFLTPQYAKTGIAPLTDFLITGCYYTTPTIYNAMMRGTSIGSTVEAAGSLSNRLARDDAWVYAGISLINFKDDPEGLANALQAACGSTQGVMVFDLSHDIEPMWPVFQRAFSVPARPPHSFPATMADIRRRRKQLDAIGKREPPVILAAGSAGIGQ